MSNTTTPTTTEIIQATDDALFEAFEDRKLVKTKKKLVKELWDFRGQLGRQHTALRDAEQEVEELRDCAEKAVFEAEKLGDIIERLKTIIVEMCAAEIGV